MTDERDPHAKLNEVLSGFMNFATALAAVAVEVQTRIQKWIDDHPHVFHPDNIKRWQELQRWAENLPQGLAESLGNSGVVFHPELTLQDLYEVEQAFRAGGEPAAQTEMLRLQGELVAIVLLGTTCGVANIASFGGDDLSFFKRSLYVMQLVAAPAQVLVLRTFANGYVRPHSDLAVVAACALVGTPFHAFYPRPVGAVATVLGVVAWLFCIVAIASQVT